MLRKTDKLSLKSQADTVHSPELSGNVNSSKLMEDEALNVTSVLVTL